MIITITNNKGGVLKTTIAVNLAKFFSVDQKKRTLLIDTDQQGNVAIQFGYQPDSIKNTISNFIEGTEKDPLKCGFQVNPKLNIIASNLEISFLEESLKISGIKKLIDWANNNFDLIIIDTSPSINAFIVSIWEQSDKLIIPSTPEFQSVNGIKLILESVSDLNFKKLIDIYVVWTRYNKRSVLHNEITNDWKNKINELAKTIKKGKIHWFNNWISNSVQNETAVAYQKLPLSFVKSKHRNVEEFESLASFLISGKQKKIKTNSTKEIKGI